MRPVCADWSARGLQHVRHPLPPPWDDEVARLLGQVARAIHRLVERRLAQRGDDEPSDLMASEQAQVIAGPPLPDRAPLPSSTSRRSAFLEGWKLTLTPDEVARLYDTYSPIATRPDRATVLAELRRIAAEQFGGQVTRNMTTSLCVARRAGAI